LTHETLDAQVTKAISWIYKSYVEARDLTSGLADRDARHPEWTRRILDALGAPDRKSYNVAVTGSKGKGSHAILLASMLQKLGLRVGLFTSPHLVDFLERFRINGEQISQENFLTYVQRVQSVTDNFRLPHGQYYGPVGLLAAIAVQWFADNDTDVNIFELGRGALHDDVNQVTHQGAVITPIFEEHLAQLGPTFLDVCREKGGVLTADTEWVVTSSQQPVMLNLLQVTAAQGATCRVILPTPVTAQDARVSETGVTLTVTDMPMPSQPDKPTVIHVGHNLAPFLDNVKRAWCAVAQIMMRIRPACHLPAEIHLENVWLPGRMDIIDRIPLTMLDGTVHRDGAVRVRTWMGARRQGTCTSFGAVLCLPTDKDGAGVIDVLWDKLSFIVFCKASNPHLSFDESFATYARQKSVPTFVVSNLREALACAHKQLPEDAGLLLLGTQSFVGDVLCHYQVDMRNLWRAGRILTENV